MSTTSSAVSSLASQLRRSASNLSDSILSDNLGYASTRLAFDDDHAARVASSAQSFSDSVNTTPSSRVRRFLDSLSSKASSDSSLPLRSEHRDLLRTGAAGEVMSDLTRDGQFDRVDLLHGYLNSVIDRNSTDSQDGRLVRALRSSGPPSYRSDMPGSPPPSYTSPLRTISSGSTVPRSSQSRDTSPYELDSAIGDMNWSPTTSPSFDRDTQSRVAELQATPVSIYEMDASSTPSSAVRHWGNPIAGQTSLARSVMANSSAPSSHPASRYFSSLVRTRSSATSSKSRISKASRYPWKMGRSLARRLSRSSLARRLSGSSRSSAVELDGRPVRRGRSRVSFAPCTTSHPSSVQRTRTRSDRSDWIPASLRIGQAPSLTSANSRPTQASSDWVPSPLRIERPSLTSNKSGSGRTVSTLARSINSLASQTPSYVLLRRQAEFARSQTRTRQAITSALASDALSRLRSSLLDYLASASRASRNTNQQFEEGSAFQSMSNSLATASIPQFYRAAEVLEREGGNRAGRAVDIEEIDDLISGLQEYRHRLRGYQESSLAV